jgi:ring-1,2-phenylacetyl-CoA epoxidase subunit PaaC
MNPQALKELIYKMADDLLILGHRSSEWIGLGPLLEEDIAFASKAQDKVGQSLAFYELLESLGEQDPDTIAFNRKAEDFHNCTFVELPNGDFDFSMIRHFLFDNADALRYQMLRDSGFEPLSQLARKFTGELQYHTLHANEWIKQLGTSTDDAIQRMQEQLTAAMPFALGIFERSPFEDELRSSGVFAGEAALRDKWLEKIAEVVAPTALTLPDLDTLTPEYGGRQGKHTEHLQPLLTEMGEVIQIDPSADW